MNPSYAPDQKEIALLNWLLTTLLLILGAVVVRHQFESLFWTLYNYFIGGQPLRGA